MDRLMALQAFARVVELGGFTKAGDSLNMPKTTVSDLVQSLESHLGVRLLQRTTRRVTVTPDGAAFYERCANILADLEEAEASVMQARVAPKGRLRVDMPGGLARHLIIPNLPAVSQPLSRPAPAFGHGTSNGASAGGGNRLRDPHRHTEGFEPGGATSRHDVHHLLCEPGVLDGAWNPAPARRPFSSPVRYLFISFRKSHRLGIHAGRARRCSSHSKAYWQ